MEKVPTWLLEKGMISSGEYREIRLWEGKPRSEREGGGQAEMFVAKKKREGRSRGKKFHTHYGHRKSRKVKRKKRTRRENRALEERPPSIL